MAGQANITFTLDEDQFHLLAAARGGDPEAFRNLAEPHRGELLTHCYRMLGSLEDAEDQVQETLLRAWRRLETYKGEAPFRAWLYKISTNACLDALEHRPRRTLPIEVTDPADPTAPFPQPATGPVWVLPFPDELLAPTSSSPEAQYDAYESISLAFLVALQVLPPRQRAVLILAEVLSWPMAEIANALNISLEATASLAHRARAKIEKQKKNGKLDIARISTPDQQVRTLLDRYVQAWEAADIESIVSLLRQDATLSMPPLPVWYKGRTAIRQLFTGLFTASGTRSPWKLLPVRANGQPGFAFYRFDPGTQAYQPFAIQVIHLKEDLISSLPTFGYPDLIKYFGLPEMLEGEINRNG